MEDIKIIHDNNIEEIILINYFTSIVEKNNKERGEFLLENDILKIKWENDLYQEFIKNDDINDEIYIYTEISNNNNNELLTDQEYIHILHNKWSDNCIIKNDIIYRNKDEFGKCKYINNLLIIYWEKWNYEIFFNDNDIYKLINLSVKLNHIDWNDQCLIKEEYIYRGSNENEFGTYIYDYNKLIINWNNWDPDIFIKLDEEYYHENLIKYIEIDNIKYIIYNNNIYDNSYDNNIIADIDIKDRNICAIHWNNNDISEEYYCQNFNEKNIKIYKNNYKEIILLKDNESICIINLINNEIKSDYKIGIFNFDELENILSIDWNNDSNTETYKLVDDKYYYKDYLELNDLNIILISENEKMNVKINFFENYFITDKNIKIKFITSNNIYYTVINNALNKFYLYKVYDIYLLVIENIFLKKNSTNNNNITDIDSYISTLQNINKPLSNLFKILFNNFSLKNNNIHSNNHYNNPINNYIKIYDNLIFIINLDNLDNLDNILEYLPKISNIIINLKDDYNIDLLKDKYKNLIITRSFNTKNYYILKYIADNILIKIDFIDNFNIFYITNDNKVEENIIDLPNYNNNLNRNYIYYNNSKKYLNQKNNYLFNIFLLSTNYYEKIIILIFYYFLHKSIFDLCNDNFILNSNLLYKLLDNNFDKKFNCIE